MHTDSFRDNISTNVDTGINTLQAMIFKPSERDQAIAYLDGIFKAKRFAKIERVTESKSLSQNNYCWLCFTHIAFCTGNDKDDIYHFCLDKFALRHEVKINGTSENIIVSLSKMDKDQCRIFIDKFIIFFAQEGIALPNPEDKKVVEMYNWYKERGMI